MFGLFIYVFFVVGKDVVIYYCVYYGYVVLDVGKFGEVGYDVGVDVVQFGIEVVLIVDCDDVQNDKGDDGQDY